MNGKKIIWGDKDLLQLTWLRDEVNFILPFTLGHKLGWGQAESH